MIAQVFDIRPRTARLGNGIVEEKVKAVARCNRFPMYLSCPHELSRPRETSCGRAFHSRAGLGGLMVAGGAIRPPEGHLGDTLAK